MSDNSEDYFLYIHVVKQKKNEMYFSCDMKKKKYSLAIHFE